MKKLIVEAISQLTVLSYFPAEAGAREALMQMFDRMIETPEQLAWLVLTLIDRVGVYEGPAQIRGVFCQQFKPKDDIEANVLPGGRLYKSEEQLLDEYRTLEAAERKPLSAATLKMLPAVKRLQ